MSSSRTDASAEHLKMLAEVTSMAQTLEGRGELYYINVLSVVRAIPLPRDDIAELCALTYILIEVSTKLDFLLRTIKMMSVAKLDRHALFQMQVRDAFHLCREHEVLEMDLKRRFALFVPEVTQCP